MFLKRIEAEGFKSFASKTIISFPTDGLVGFVGPNGSGKSNINDAIKWVLGEQSVKSLRGSSMSDIIFAGSKERNASDVCEVTLVFNNKDKILNSKFSEISVTRRIYRDQQANEYFINKERCRLKDVRYLMMNTGLGKNSFSIVSQGSITKLADAKPLERKYIFEEAAGVSIYKDQKMESLRKLDRTSQNLNIVEVSIAELKKQVKPLEKQAEKAKIFLEKRKILEKYEVSLIAEELKYDLVEINKVNDLVKSSELEKDLNSNLVDNNQSKTTNINQKLIILEDEINELQHNQRDIQTRINNISKNKVAEVQESLNKNNIKKLIEEIIQEELLLNDDLEATNVSIDSIKSQKNNAQQLVTKTINSVELLKYDLSRLRFEKEAIDNKLKNRDHLSSGPSVIIQNKSMFPTIIDIVSNLFNVDVKHETAIQTALGFSGAQNIVVKNDKYIKDIIKFLKDGKHGRATFLPLNIIKQRYVDEKSLAVLKNIKGFEGVASNIVKFKDEVEPAIKFLLGNNIIFDTIDNALAASKLINGKYKIITLEGEIINPGFSVTGGTKSMINKTLNLNDKIKIFTSKIKEKDNEIRKEINELNIHKHTVEELIEQLNIKNSSLARFQEKQQNHHRKISYLKEQYKNIMGKEYDVNKNSSINKGSLLSLTNELSGINESLELKTILRIKYVKEQQEISLQISGWNKDLINAMDKLGELKVQQSQLETRIGYNLETLNNDYKLTLHSIKDHRWTLKETKDEVREIVSDIKGELSRLGYVNVEAIEQYQDVKNRYEELRDSYDELKSSQNKLLDTIEILDGKMEDSLRETVEKIRVKFQGVFKDIFRGGTADLRWEDENDILNSGIEVIAKPPGKEIKNISLFSGGEKSMIAITLIFAILQVAKLPLLILDEAEAALDEANVERYARYCLELNKLTQVILVTHRPGTMENCDLLYGVTMEEKGITKLLSIKLEQAKKMG